MCPAVETGRALIIIRMIRIPSSENSSEGARVPEHRRVTCSPRNSASAHRHRSLRYALGRKGRHVQNDQLVRRCKAVLYDSSAYPI
jgi:hypothetical protein